MKRLIEIDGLSWWKGFYAGAGNCKNNTPKDTDSFSWISGFIEGKATK